VCRLPRSEPHLILTGQQAIQPSQRFDVKRTYHLTSSNKFELLFRWEAAAPGSELFGINVFKVREILDVPPVTSM
jgi:chemotaxis signal transduction protein